MKDGFIKTACAAPEIKVADCEFNSGKIIECMENAAKEGAALCAFPELCITGCTCGDLFFQSTLQNGALSALKKIIDMTAMLGIVGIVGLPVAHMGKLYSCGTVFSGGKLHGIAVKKNIPNYREFYEARHFTPGMKHTAFEFFGEEVPMGTDIVFCCREMNEFSFGVEICEDLWVADTPSVRLAQNGANIIVNLSASNEIIGKADYRRTIIKAKSGSLLCGYIYANAGMGESTTDAVYSGHSLIAENGTLLAESELFTNGIIYADIDVQKMQVERQRMNTFTAEHESGFERIAFHFDIRKTTLTRHIDPNPFVPSDSNEVGRRCREISLMQSAGLVKRLEHTHCKTAVLGLSGGLDSTLALIVTVNAFDRLGLDRKGITAVTMPCFGTTDRTYKNACLLAEKYGVTLREIDIKASVKQHFSDIGQDENTHDVTYENGQARERTQVLMDIANKLGGMVIGTGDLSELALGWATYNGDHMSMYGVNSSIPKTLVRYLVRYESDCRGGELGRILTDVLNTPVSPELLPPENGSISQKTEDLVGPYELHDFFLYYMVRFGFSPKKIYRMACIAFDGIFEKTTVLHWEKVFFKRFFAQQFKRSCLPDGPKVGSVTLSPRSDFRMPSDATVHMWMRDFGENLK